MGRGWLCRGGSWRRRSSGGGAGAAEGGDGAGRCSVDARVQVNFSRKAMVQVLAFLCPLLPISVRISYGRVAPQLSTRSLSAARISQMYKLQFRSCSNYSRVLIIYPSNENVILVAEELHIRLAPSSASHLDGKDNLSGQHDGKVLKKMVMIGIYIRHQDDKAPRWYRRVIIFDPLQKQESDSHAREAGPILELVTLL